MRRHVLDALDGSVLQPDERPLIVLSTERIAGDLSERECFADPFSSPGGRHELMRPEDATVGDDRVVAAPSDDPFAGFELGLEKGVPFAPESLATSMGLATRTTQLSA